MEISREEVIMPGGVELTKEAEQHMGLGPPTTLLSVACGTGELELYLAEKYKCNVVGIDLGIECAFRFNQDRRFHLAESVASRNP